jgi:hypothetical protein
MEQRADGDVYCTLVVRAARREGGLAEPRGRPGRTCQRGT